MKDTAPPALVIGSTGGIVAKLAEALAACGYRLLLQDLDHSRLQHQAALYPQALR